MSEDQRGNKGPNGVAKRPIKPIPRNLGGCSEFSENLIALSRPADQGNPLYPTGLSKNSFRMEECSPLVRFLRGDAFVHDKH